MKLTKEVSIMALTEISHGSRRLNISMEMLVWHAASFVGLSELGGNGSPNGEYVGIASAEGASPIAMSAGNISDLWLQLGEELHDGEE